MKFIEKILIESFLKENDPFKPRKVGEDRRLKGIELERLEEKRLEDQRRSILRYLENNKNNFSFAIRPENKYIGFYSYSTQNNIYSSTRNLYIHQRQDEYFDSNRNYHKRNLITDNYETFFYITVVKKNLKNKTTYFEFWESDMFFSGEQICFIICKNADDFSNIQKKVK